MSDFSRDQLAARPPPPRKLRVPGGNVDVLESTIEPSPGGTEAKRVVIDGVIFQFEKGGNKLVRIGGEALLLTAGAIDSCLRTRIWCATHPYAAVAQLWWRAVPADEEG